MTYFVSNTVGPLRPYFPKMTSWISWLLIGGEHLRKNLRKMVASDWLLKIVGRKSDDIGSKNSSKISLVWRMGPLRPYFPKMTSQMSWLRIGGEDLRKIVGKRRQGFGNRRQGKRKKKRGGVGWGRQERKREGWVGWVMTSSKKIKIKK